MLDNGTDPCPAPNRYESILVEIMEAEEQGRVIDENRYLESFPEHAEPLREYFHNRKRVAALVQTVVTVSPIDSEIMGANRIGLKVGCTWAGFVIEEELGRGGMGIVYRARQLKPERQVALKVIRMDRLESLPVPERRQWLDRFQREAQLVAALDRPDHIVSLYEVGEHAGQPYFTMRLVTGGTLAARLKQLNEGEPAAAQRRRLHGQRDSARLLASVARAVHYAHQRGILHRDLKPANILLDEQGQPLVSDFGLARRVDQTGSLVESGIEGTAEYMSPEQARAEPGAATTATDVYSLGVILYECLTGRTPFQGKTVVETLMLVLHEEATPPHSLNPPLDRNLEAICLQCLQKESALRYSSAAALADDLDNWLAGRPLNVRPAGPIERLWRWGRRNPALAGAFSLAALAFLVVTVVSVLFAFYRDAAARLLDQALTDTEEQRQAAVEASMKHRTTAEQLRVEKQSAQESLVGLALDRASQSGEEGDPAIASLWLAKALEQVPANAPDLQEAVRLSLAAWGRTLNPHRSPLHHPGIVASVGFNSDGRKLLTLNTGTLRLEERDWGDGKKRLTRVFRPDTISDDFVQDSISGPMLNDTIGFKPRRRQPSTPRGRLLAWDAATGKPLDVALPAEMRVLAISPDGRAALASKGQAGFPGSMTIQFWDLAEGKAMAEPLALRTSIRMAVFSCDGKTVLTIGGWPEGGGWAEAWDAGTGKCFQQLGSFSSIALSPDRRFAVLSSGTGGFSRTATPLIPRGGPSRGAGRIALYDLTERKMLAAPGEFDLDADSATAVGPQGRMLLTVGAPDSLRGVIGYLWDRERNKMAGKIRLDGPVKFAAFSPDGQTLLTVCRPERWAGLPALSERETIRLWSVASAEPIGSPLPQFGALRAFTFSPDSKLLATAGGESAEGEAQLWDVGTGHILGRSFRHQGVVLAVAFSPDGKKFLTGAGDGTARLWDVEASRPVRPLVHLGRVLDLSSDGRIALAREDPSRLRLIETASGRPRGEPIPYSDKDRAVIIGPDRHTILIAHQGKTAQLWDGETGKPIGEPLEHLEPVETMRFSRDGKDAMTATAWMGRRDEKPVVYRWDARTGKSLGFLKESPPFDRALAISSDGLWVLSAFGNMAWISDGTTGKNLGGRLDHRSPVRAALFSPDGKIVLTVSGRSGSWEEARLWQVATGQPIGSPLSHKGLIRATAFSPNNQIVATVSEDRTARLWESATGQPLGSPLAHPSAVLAVAFSPDNRMLVTGSTKGTVRLWHVATRKSIGPPLPCPGPVSFVIFDAGQQTVLARSEDGSLRRWEMFAPLTGEANALLLQVQLMTGMELDSGVPRLLDDSELTRRAQQLRQRMNTLP